jgi:TolA-binding protein
MFPRFAFLLLTCFFLGTQSAAAQQTRSPASNQAAPPAAAPPSDRIQQMRADLNQMESLMNNMQSEINFLRDQNLQILLNTNVRMWTILIRDLRRQLDDEEQRRVVAPPTPARPKP